MKKFVALLIAGVMSVGVFSLMACNNDHTESDGGEYGEEMVKIPEIPEGIVLNDVDLDNMEATRSEFNNNRHTSKNLRMNTYAHYKRYDTEGKFLDEDEDYTNAKYLDKDGKTYGESRRHTYSHDLNKSYYVESGSGNVYDFEWLAEQDTTAFLMDKNIGLIDEYKNSGHSIEKYPDDNIDRESEVDEAFEPCLQTVYVNGEDYFKNGIYEGIEVLNATTAEVQDNITPCITDSDSFQLCSYGVSVHTRYTESNDIIDLILGKDAESIMALIINGIDFELVHYDFTMQADETKFYIKQDYKINLVYKESNSISSTIECTYIAYEDTESDVTEKSFKSNYLTDNLLTDTYYYDCNNEQVAADFMAGKDIVIDPVGGYDVSDLSYEYSNNTYLKYSPYIAYVDGDKILNGYISGFVDSHVKVENGKVVINSAGALDVAKQYAQARLDRYGEFLGIDSFNFDNAKMYLVISWTLQGQRTGALYIPLN